MSRSLAVRGTLAAAGLCAITALSGCNEGVAGPEAKPDLVIQQVVTNTVWDFTGLIATADGVQDWGTSKTITNGTFGSMVATSGAGAHVTSKGRELPVGDTERGLGLCLVVGQVCSGDEVGDGGPGSLFLNLNGVLPAGSTLTQIDLGSVQIAEGWKISYSYTGGAPFTLLSSGEGNGINNPGDNLVITGGPLPLATANLLLLFEKNTAASGNLSTDNDYVLKSVTTHSETGGGCTFTQGYWKNHSGIKANIPNTWPVNNLTLGTVNYTQAQLIAIMQASTAGNGLLSLAQQLIAAKLNVANGASPAPQAIADADALIGGLVIPPVGSGFLAPATTSALNTALTNFNEGTTGPGHCD